MVMWDCFISSVNHHFKYLETEFEFSRVSTDIPFIVYKSSLIRVDIFWECGGRYELDLIIDINGESDKYKHSLHINDLIRIHRQRDNRNYEWIMINTKEKLDSGVQELAQLLYKHGLKLLQHDQKEIKRTLE